MYSDRKLDHIQICLHEDVEAQGISSEFEQYHFVHKALPEIAADTIDLSVQFLGKRLRAPTIISAITGGTDVSARINGNLAAAAQRLGIAMSVGSQRPAIENDELAHSYKVRDVAPDVLLFANLGAVQLNYGYGVRECQQAVQMIRADGLILHLNPLQECIQSSGNSNFSGLLSRIGEVCASLTVPVMVKEVGCGISAEVASDLMSVGVSAIDVAGAGGTSWALVEKYRAKDESMRRIADTFAAWGIPTARSLRSVREALPDLPLVASGGIRNGIDAAKALALGADIFGLALPLLKPALNSVEAVEEQISRLHEELRITMFCVGVRAVAELKQTKLDRG